LSAGLVIIDRANRLEWTWWIRAGERLSIGLDILTAFESNGNPRCAPVLERIRSEIGRGHGIVQAFRGSAVNLPGEAWCLLESGEHTGRLGEAMKDVGKLLREQERRRAELLNQLWYPALVVLTGFLVMGIILLWVVPQLRSMNSSMGQGNQLPWLTEHIGLIYGGGLGFLMALLLSLVAGIRILVCLGRRSSGASRFRERVCNRSPVVGVQLFQRREARLLRQLGTLLRGGVTLPAALQMVAEGTPDLWEKEQVLEFRRNLLSGASFSESIRSFALTGQEVRPLLMAGQESGRLEIYMLRHADDLDWRTRLTLNRWIRLLEPTIIGLLSMLVGGLVLAYLLPMIRMLERLA
jgi:type IV pilus assembly protein PilC